MPFYLMPWDSERPAAAVWRHFGDLLMTSATVWWLSIDGPSAVMSSIYLLFFPSLSLSLSLSRFLYTITFFFLKYILYIFMGVVDIKEIDHCTVFFHHKWCNRSFKKISPPCYCVQPKVSFFLRFTDRHSTATTKKRKMKWMMMIHQLATEFLWK